MSVHCFSSALYWQCTIAAIAAAVVKLCCNQSLNTFARNTIFSDNDQHYYASIATFLWRFCDFSAFYKCHDLLAYLTVDFTSNYIAATRSCQNDSAFSLKAKEGRKYFPPSLTEIIVKQGKVEQSAQIK